MLHTAPLRADVVDAASIAPADVELFVAFDDAAKLRAGPAGRAIAAVLEGFIGLTDINAAWMRFASELRLTPEQTFDLLFGRKAAFLSRRGPGAAEASWVVVSTIDRKADVLLRATLAPAPRGLARGRTVLSIEDGKFWLAVGAAPGEDVRLLLGPAGAPELFEQLLGALPSAEGKPGITIEPSIASRPYFKDLRALDANASAILYWKWPAGGPDDDAASPSWFACSARPDGRMLQLGFMAAVPPPEAGRAAAPLWSRAAFDRVAALTAFAVMTTEEHAGLLGGSLRSWLEVLPELPRELMIDDGRGAPLLGPRRLIAITASEEAMPTPMVAFESSHIDRAAHGVDRFMSGLASWFDQALNQDDEPPQPAPNPGPAEQPVPVVGAAPDGQNFGGLFPEATRLLPWPGPLGRILANGSKDGAQLVWTLRPGGSVHDEPRAGWWTAGIDESAVETLAAALATPDEPDAADRIPWLSLGSARPAALSRSVLGAGLPIPMHMARAVGSLKHIEQVEWQTLLSGGTRIVGLGTVRFAP